MWGAILGSLGGGGVRDGLKSAKRPTSMTIITTAADIDEERTERG